MSAGRGPLESILDFAVRAKDRALDLSVRARDQAQDVGDQLRSEGLRVGERIQNGKVFTEPDGGAAIALRGIQTACTIVGALSLATYLIPTFFNKLYRPQNLVKKYNAKWAVVTGGSSGIGLAIVEKLATQGANVVIVAYPDSAFEKNLKMVRAKYPNVTFRDVSVDLSKPGGYLDKIIKATEDIDVQILFNNAGYIKTGFFVETSLESQLGNHTCNATAALEITHHFAGLMQRKKLKGCIGFTSSPAGLTPTPSSVVYGSTKAFLTEFAASIAPELYPDGIDVCVVHPSPVASRFYEGTHPLGSLNFFKSTATGPEKIADALFASMGRTVVRDQGYYPTMTKIILKILDYNLIADLATMFATSMPEFKVLREVKPVPRAA